ncbi:MAG: putative amidohydrolase [Arenicella sp.]|jgi:predicted amidohydrolase
MTLSIEFNRKPKMKICLAQIDVQLGCVEENTKKMTRWIERAGSEGNDLIVFPEMSDTGYDMEVILKTSSDWNSGVIESIKQAAAKANINVIAGISERVAGDVYNSIAVLDRNGKQIGKYRKTHLITAEPTCEQLFLKAGDQLGVVEIEGHLIGLMTCYEIRFPEIARTLALRGAEILVIPAAWPLIRLPHWEALILARAIENQVFVAATSRIGNDTGVPFSGTSTIISPYGNIMASASQIHEELITTNINFDFIDEVRAQVKVHQDRRVDLYSNI